VVFDGLGVFGGHQLKREVPGGARVFHAPPSVTAFSDAGFPC
jgi:hypothetical protein